MAFLPHEAPTTFREGEYVSMINHSRDPNYPPHGTYGRVNELLNGTSMIGWLDSKFKTTETAFTLLAHIVPSAEKLCRHLHAPKLNRWVSFCLPHGYMPSDGLSVPGIPHGAMGVVMKHIQLCIVGVQLRLEKDGKLLPRPFPVAIPESMLMTRKC